VPEYPTRVQLFLQLRLGIARHLKCCAPSCPG
jgi:hypothetical protein